VRGTDSKSAILVLNRSSDCGKIRKDSSFQKKKEKNRKYLKTVK
jgi:hypothetical protein